MTLTDLSVAAERLKFLHKVVKREVKHFQTTDARLFAKPLTLELVQQLEVDEELAERVEAFISRSAVCRIPWAINYCRNCWSFWARKRV